MQYLEMKISDDKKLIILTKQFDDLKLNCDWERMKLLVGLHYDFLDNEGWNVDAITRKLNLIIETIDEL